VATKLASASSAQVWEHVIREDNDYAPYIDYMDWNPMKHSLVKRISDLPEGHKGLIPAFIAMCNKGFIRKIGQATRLTSST
jgi:hypothetical protein